MATDEKSSPSSSSSASGTTTTGTSTSGGAGKRADGPKDGDGYGYANPVHSLTEDEAREAHEQRLDQLAQEADWAAQNQPISHYNAADPNAAPAMQTDGDDRDDKTRR